MLEVASGRLAASMEGKYKKGMGRIDLDRNKAVMRWIENNFFIDAVKIEDFDLFPFGKRLVDKNGEEMIIFFDLLHNRVDYRFPDKLIKN